MGAPILKFNRYRLKTLQTHNGGEDISTAFKRYLAEYGISAQTTAPYTPEQNGVSERMNRTLVECARTMLHANGLDYKFWGEAIMTAAHIRNRCLTKKLNGKTPEEIWTGVMPSIAHLRTFGCVGYD